MRETLCTIPINDILRERDGCPVCRMRKIVEQRMIEYTLGDSMMEPDTRQQTNLLGFCERHLSMLKVGKNRLALALMLKTHLDEIEKNVLSGGLLGGPKKSAEKAKNIEKSCFVCDGIEKNMTHLAGGLIKSYGSDPEARKMFAEQEYLCLPDFALLCGLSEKMMQKSAKKPFFDDCVTLCKNYLEPLKTELELFSKMFDYRSDPEADEFKNAKHAIEHAGYFLFSNGDERITLNEEG